MISLLAKRPQKGRPSAENEKRTRGGGRLSGVKPARVGTGFATISVFRIDRNRTLLQDARAYDVRLCRGARTR